MIGAKRKLRQAPKLAVGIAVLMLAVTACAANKDDTSMEGCEKTYTIAFTHSTSEAAVVKSVRAHADKRAAEIGCVKVLHDNTQTNNLETQLAAVETWINQKVDAMVVLAIDPTALEPLRKRAQEAGIKWLSYGVEIDGADGVAGLDHATSGKVIGEAAAEWVKKTFPRGGAKALVTSLKALPFVGPRWNEPIKALEAAGVEVVAVQDAFDQANGLTVTETTLQAHPDLDIVIGMNDDAAVGAYRAFQNADKDPATSFIGGQDGSVEGLKAIKEGGAYKASATIVLKKLGANIVDLSLNAIKGKGETKQLAPVELVTGEDKTKLDELISQFN